MDVGEDREAHRGGARDSSERAEDARRTRRARPACRRSRECSRRAAAQPGLRTKTPRCEQRARASLPPALACRHRSRRSSSTREAYGQPSSVAERAVLVAPARDFGDDAATNAASSSAASAPICAVRLTPYCRRIFPKRRDRFARRERVADARARPGRRPSRTCACRIDARIDASARQTAGRRRNRHRLRRGRTSVVGRAARQRTLRPRRRRGTSRSGCRDSRGRPSRARRARATRGERRRGRRVPSSRYGTVASRRRSRST